MEIAGSPELRVGLSPAVEQSIPLFIDKAAQIIKEWVEEDDSFKKFFG
jgi:Ni,Fe-hydrogenase maturation factor